MLVAAPICHEEMPPQPAVGKRKTPRSIFRIQRFGFIKAVGLSID